MSFTFPVLTEEEINAANLIDPGIYNFTITKATQKTSNAGNPMIELQLKVWDINGKEHPVFDYLVATKATSYKIKHFCDAVGLEAAYLAGTFQPEDCENLSGKVEIIIQDGQMKKDGSGFYSSKNAVKDYLVQGATVNASEGRVKVDEEPFFDDSVPF